MTLLPSTGANARSVCATENSQPVRGYVDQQNSQPVQWDALLEKIGMASGAVQFHEFFLYTVNEQPVRFDVAIPEGTPVPYQGMGPVSGVQLLASGQRFDNVIELEQILTPPLHAPQIAPETAAFPDIPHWRSRERLNSSSVCVVIRSGCSPSFSASMVSALGTLGLNGSSPYIAT